MNEETEERGIYFTVGSGSDKNQYKLNLPKDLSEKLFKLVDVGVLTKEDIEDTILFQPEPQAIQLIYQLVEPIWFDYITTRQ